MRNYLVIAFSQDYFHFMPLPARGGLLHPTPPHTPASTRNCPSESHGPAVDKLAHELCNSPKRWPSSAAQVPLISVHLFVWSSSAPASLGMALENCELLPEIKKIRPTVLPAGMERTWNPPSLHLYVSQNSCSVRNTASILHFLQIRHLILLTAITKYNCTVVL